VALWIPNQISAHYGHVSREFSRLVKQAQCELIVVEVGVPDVEQVISHVPVDAVVAVDAPDQVEAYLQTPTAKAIPIVGMGALCCKRADSIQVDLLAGTAELMEHLLGSGFRHIAHMKYKRNDLPEASRRLGYAWAMRQARLEPEFIEMPFTETERAVARETIFCHCDDMALGTYRGLCDVGVRVPAEVALAGCDGIEDVEYLECPLTTIAQPMGEMCATAWQFVQQRLEQAQTKRQRAVLRPKLLVREIHPPQRVRRRHRARELRCARNW
jgi:DNA-binding LacI/PurR family transcriptional regulator